MEPNQITALIVDSCIRIILKLDLVVLKEFMKNFYIMC